jgi:hypothetical protein
VTRPDGISSVDRPGDRKLDRESFGVQLIGQVYERDLGA